MNMICCELLPSLCTHKSYDGPLMIGQELMSFAIPDTAESHDASGSPIKPLRVN
jgi:hypothetical protein